jgi:Plavaka transposase
MVGDRPVVYFPFLDSLRDLLLSTTFDDVDNLCVNKEEQDRFKPFQPVTNDDYGELMVKDWARESLEGIEDFDAEKDLFLPVMMYGDKTGTDVNQRYPLEPWMFTICILRRSTREKSKSWRHLGFQPSLDFVESFSTVEKLQLYHEYMSVLLRDFKAACHNKPVMWVNLGGVWEKRRLHLKLAIISGDQLSQDYICGRMPINSGNAGRIHRGCGSSAIHLGNALDQNGILSKSCRGPPTELLKRLNNLALLDVTSLEQGQLNELLPPASGRQTRKQNKLVVEYLLRVKKLAKAILNKTFSMYELTNAFEGIDFGSNTNGVLVATTEDHLHSFEAGAMHQLAEVSYHGLSPSERPELEGIIRKKVMNCRSSALSEIPRGTVKKDFGKLTLSSHNEKVGSVFYLLLALHDRRGRELFQKAHERQSEKYLSFTVEQAAAKEKNLTGSAIPAADPQEETFDVDITDAQEEED